jgi:hypothetical protein
MSHKPISTAVPALAETWHFQEERADIGGGLGLRANVTITGATTGELRVDLSEFRQNEKPLSGRLILRQGMSTPRTFSQHTPLFSLLKDTVIALLSFRYGLPLYSYRVTRGSNNN